MKKHNSQILQILLVLFISLNTIYSLTYNTEYAKTWNWKRQSLYTSSYMGNQYQGYSHGAIYGDLPLGIEIKDDGTLFSVDLIEQQLSGRVCFGVHDVDNWAQTNTHKDSNWASFAQLACTDRNNYVHSGQEFLVHSPFNDREEVAGKFDIVVGTDFMIVSNERYGQFTNIQFTLDSSKKYFPVVYFYSSDPVYPIKLQFNACYTRCGSCDDWEPKECITCRNSDSLAEAAPSCECKPGNTDYYNHQKNDNCQAEPNYYIPDADEWKWISLNTPVNQEQESIGQFEFTTGTNTIYADVDPDIGIVPQQDGTKWTIELVSQEVQGHFFCIGIMRTQWQGINQSRGNAMNFCSDYNIYHYDAVSSTFQEYGNRDGYGPGMTNQKFDLIFTDTEFIITNIPYHGTTDYKWEWNPAYKYYPWLQTSTKTISRVNKCSPRCLTCEYMQPHVCLTCSDASNRSNAPDCSCNAGRQDTFRIPNDHHIQDACILDYQYHMYSPPEWVWTSESTNIEEENGFFTTTSGYSNTYVNLGNQGIKVQKDAVKWTVKITNHEGVNSGQWMCFGIQKTERLLSISWNGSSRVGAIICTDGNIYHQDTLLSKTLSGEIPRYGDATGWQIDFFYNYGFLRVSDTAYGGNFYHEFTLNENINFVPFAIVYSINDMQPQVFQVHNCSPKCYTCWPFNPTNCINCNDALNRPSTPNCECKAGYEDYYDEKVNEKCRVIPPWIEKSYPEWTWKTESLYAQELVDLEINSHQNGFFIAKNNGYSHIKLEKNNVLEHHTKWTVKIIQHNGSSNVCFGIIKQEYSDLTYYGSDYGKTVSQCTSASTTSYNHDPKSVTTYKGKIEPRADQSGQIYDIYYDVDKLIITNVDRGGYFTREFQLTPTMKYTPYLQIYGTDTIVQVKGCSDRCKTCYDWDPEKCTECKQTLYRLPAPSCECEETYEDIYDDELHEQCRQIEVYNEMKSPQWKWKTTSVNIEEDTQNGKENYGTFTSTASDGSILVDGLPPIDDYSKWTIKILEHPQNGRIGLCVSEADRARSINVNAYQVSHHQCFTTDNYVYSYDGFTGATSNTFIMNDMPSTTRQSLNGEIFDLYYKKDLLYITNEEYRGADGGRLIRARIELNPNLSYTPYITISGQFTQIQVKSCSVRCSGCLDWRPRQCINCSDSQNREVAPCCAPKYGFTDEYQYQINEKCILDVKVPLAKYPQFNWEQQTVCNNCSEDQKNRGLFRVNNNDHLRISPKDYILDHESGPIMWEVKIVEASAAGYSCYGIIQATRAFTSSLSYQIMVCNDGSTTTHYGTAYGGNPQGASMRHYGKFPSGADRQNMIGETLQIIYTPTMLQVTNVPYGGTVNIEIDIDPNIRFRPSIVVYGQEEQIQVRSCNFKCETCKDWTPDHCYTCAGNNRTVPPLCGCQNGFTDYYHNEYHQNCIAIKNHYHPYPQDWVWKTRSTLDNIVELGNGYWELSGNHVFLYADVGRQGIYGGTGGTKWSIEFTKVEHTSSEIVAGIQKNENILTYSPTGDYRNNMAGVGLNRIPYQDSRNVVQQISKDVFSYSQDFNLGMRYDFYYEKGFLRISNTAYGHHRQFEYDMIEELQFTPFVSLYSYAAQYKTVVNFKPCHWKCAECDNSVDTTICTVCADLTTRIDNSDCTCKDGYYEDPEGFYKCRPCDKSCETCSGPQTCITCKATPDRNNSPPNCSCKKGFYQNYNAFCVKCHFTCDECDGPETCTKCKVEAYRDQVTCACYDGYYDDEVSGTCSKCPSQCRTCVDGSGVCTDCACDRILFDGVNTACPCPDNSFGVSETTGTCDICTPPCSTCTSKTECTACVYNGFNRAGPPTCLCEPGHFEDEYHNCKACMTGCSICETYAYRCKQCKSDPNRSTDIKHCNCNEGFMDDPITGVCIESSCPVKCAICQPGSNEICQVCIGASSRKDVTNNCDCQDGYYEIEEEECEACPHPCGNCNNANECTTCISTDGREPAPGCQCSQGYYEDAGQTCQQCHYKCLACEGSAENCTTCKLQPNRKTTGDCSCNPGYTEDSVTQSCIALAVCAIKCETCQLSTPNVCTVCTFVPNTYRKSISDNCICQDGYFDTGVAVCSKCLDHCGTCLTGNSCTTCKYTGANRLGPEYDCACDEGYEENDSNECVEIETGCPVENGRSQDGDCECLDGYFENLSLKCQPCNKQCKTCVDTADTCIQCTEGYKQDSAPNCIKCNARCGDCGQQPDECTSCVAGRDQAPLCECLPAHYTSGADPACYPCDDSCVSCAGSASNCTQCKGNPDKRYDAPNCECWEGYYSDKYGNCKKCDYKCLTCRGAADYCTICRNGKDRILSPPHCNCKPGTYETPYNNNCEFCSQECQVTEAQYRRMLFGPSLTEQQIDLKCSVLCKSCQFESDNCLVCQPGKNTTMVPPMCECLPGFYKSSQSDSCVECKGNNCLKCNTENGQCTSCSKENMVVNVFGDCQCTKDICQECNYFQGKCVEECPIGTKSYQQQCVSQEILWQEEYQTQALYGGITGIIVLMVIFHKVLTYYFS